MARPTDNADLADAPVEENAAVESGEQKSPPKASPVAVAKPKPAKAKAAKTPPPAPSVDAPDVAVKLDIENEADANAPSAKLLSESPSWLTSLAIHLGIIVVLALWYLPEIPDITANLLLSEPSDEIEELEEVAELVVDPAELETEPVEFELQPETDFVAEEISFSTFDEASAAPSFTSLSELALTAAPPSTPTDLPGFDGTGTTGRGRAARKSLVRKHGGSQASETAVANALNWLANHQNPDGTWSLIHDRHECRGRCDGVAEIKVKGDPYTESLQSGTGLALLPFLGAGQTHKAGQHRKVVKKGLAALVAMGEAEKKRPGASWRDSGNMYAHGIAAIALCEAYGMTRDPTLRAPAQAAIDYIVYAQHEGGGWRYTPRTQVGDTSVTGWQIMALKSAYLADLSVPPPVVQRASRFLDTVQSAGGAKYSYVVEADGTVKNATNTRSSVGLLCRMYMGWDRKREALKSGIASLAKAGPSKDNYYYNYYASQVLFQYTGGQGKTWRTWNRKLRQQLVDQQATSGHELGSWYVEGGHGKRGGRIYTTSLATMCLEIYYRYMPIYKSDAVTKEFAE